MRQQLMHQYDQQQIHLERLQQLQDKMDSLISHLGMVSHANGSGGEAPCSAQQSQQDHCEPAGLQTKAGQRHQQGQPHPQAARQGEVDASEQPPQAERRTEGPDLPDQKQEPLSQQPAEHEDKAPHQNAKKKQKKKKRKKEKKSQEEEAEEAAGDRPGNSTLAEMGCGTSRQAARRRKKQAKVAAGDPGQ